MTRSARWSLLGAILAAGVSVPAWAVEPAAPSNSVGNIGLMQTPTARFTGAGTLRIGFSSARPLDAFFISAHPYDWLEATYRYTTFNYGGIDGPFSMDGLLDKSFDVKLRLLRESDWLPSLAVGLNDLGGTGLLSSEFLVAGKRWGHLDFSLGLGWGRLGARGEFRNFLDSVDSTFSTRERDLGGQIELKQFFSGRRFGTFGGVRWRPGGSRWSLMIEREGNDYSAEPFGNNLDVEWPVNLGVAYQGRNFGVRGSWERGEQWSLGLYFAADVSEPGPAKVLDPPPTPVSPPGEGGARSTASGGVDEAALRAALRRQDITLLRVETLERPPRATVWVTQGSYREPVETTLRVARAASMLLPASVETIAVVDVVAGLEQSVATVRREDIRVQASLQAPDVQVLSAYRYLKPSTKVVPEDPQLQAPWYAPDWFVAPRYRQSLGDPDEAYRAQLLLQFGLFKQWTAHLRTSAVAELGVVGNLDDIERESDSTLPRVRSDIAAYYREGEHGLRRLEANYIRPLSATLFARLSAGIFEEMYGGVAAELLYRPFASNWALGANINRVRQREFDQRFEFRDYEVTTGHATLYHHFAPLQMETRLSAGCYLAMDCGATLQVERVFRTGARFGVFATKTNVSSREFGEGSFDKGFIITIPFDLFLPRSSTAVADLSFRPLARDGGQMVRDGASLYAETRRRDVRAALRVLDTP